MELKQENSTFVVDREKSGRGRYQLDGKPLTGVTTICNEQSKGFLVDWAAKEAYKDSIGKSKEEIEEILKNKTYAHTKKGDDAKAAWSKVAHQNLGQKQPDSAGICRPHFSGS